MDVFDKAVAVAWLILTYQQNRILRAGNPPPDGTLKEPTFWTHFGESISHYWPTLLGLLMVAAFFFRPLVFPESDSGGSSRHIVASESVWPIMTKAREGAFVTALERMPPRAVDLSCTDDNCEALAEDLQAAIIRAGWTARVVGPTIDSIGSGIYLSGNVGTEEIRNSFAAAVRNATGFDPGNGIGINLSGASHLFIAIGRKPRLADKIVGEGISPPDSGNFQTGDIWRNTEPQPGGAVGWIWTCDKSSSCGWKEYGGISL